MNPRDLVPGLVFGRLTLIRPIPHPSNRIYWLVRCSCLSPLSTRTVRASDLLSGNSTSCGCLRIERLRSQSTIHASISSPTYQSWRAMLRRCHDPHFVAYRFYGALGVSVCPQWRARRSGFSTFLDDMGHRPPNTTLDRRDPYGDYTPENCRWADRFIQASNKRAFVDIQREREEYEYWSMIEAESSTT